MTREPHFRKESQTESPRFRICPTPHTTIKFAPLDSCTPAEPRLAGRSSEVLCTSPLDLAQGLRERGLNVCAFAGVWNVKIFPSHAKQQTLCLNSAKRQKRKETDRH